MRDRFSAAGLTPLLQVGAISCLDGSFLRAPFAFSCRYGTICVVRPEKGRTCVSEYVSTSEYVWLSLAVSG